MSLKLILKEPLLTRIKFKDIELTELELRDPVARDFFDLGLPMAVFSLDDKFKGLEFRMQVLANHIARLAGIPEKSVKNMAMADVGACQAFIFSFLGDFCEGKNHG